MTDATSHPHGHEYSSPPIMDEAFWDERYGSRDSLWSGDPNPQLVREAQSLQPGVGLDVGCGEGGDAIWLAQLGWHVTGVDISSVALARARAHAAQTGSDLADRLEWLHVDLDDFIPEPNSYSLVSAQFVHLATGQREDLHRRLADAVAPGGTLLIVSHDLSDLGTTMRRPPFPEFFATPEETVNALPTDEWLVVVAEARPRRATDPNGDQITIHDAVVRMQRHDH